MIQVLALTYSALMTLASLYLTMKFNSEGNRYGSIGAAALVTLGVISIWGWIR